MLQYETKQESNYDNRLDGNLISVEDQPELYIPVIAFRKDGTVSLIRGGCAAVFRKNLEDRSF